MRNLLQQHRNDLRLMAGLRATSDREGLLQMRAQIDRMWNQNLRQAALAMWHEKCRKTWWPVCTHEPAESHFGRQTVQPASAY
jgi:hypothetical protein